jgi:hypothetical protein
VERYKPVNNRLLNVEEMHTNGKMKTLGVLLKLQDTKTSIALINWLNSPCTEHGAWVNRDTRMWWSNKERHHYEHRKDCALCWKELAGEN